MAREHAILLGDLNMAGSAILGVSGSMQLNNEIWRCQHGIEDLVFSSCAQPFTKKPEMAYSKAAHESGSSCKLRARPTEHSGTAHLVPSGLVCWLQPALACSSWPRAQQLAMQPAKEQPLLLLFRLFAASGLCTAKGLHMWANLLRPKLQGFVPTIDHSPFARLLQSHRGISSPHVFEGFVLLRCIQALVTFTDLGSALTSYTVPRSDC